MGDVKAIFGGPTYERVKSDDVIAALQEAVTMAESGEIVGVVLVCAEYNGLTSFSIAGKAGSYSVIGAMEIAKAHLLRCEMDGE